MGISDTIKKGATAAVVGTTLATGSGAAFAEASCEVPENERYSASVKDRYDSDDIQTSVAVAARLQLETMEVGNDLVITLPCSDETLSLPVVDTGKFDSGIRNDHASFAGFVVDSRALFDGPEDDGSTNRFIQVTVDPDTTFTAPAADYFEEFNTSPAEVEAYGEAFSGQEIQKMHISYQSGGEAPTAGPDATEVTPEDFEAIGMTAAAQNLAEPAIMEPTQAPAPEVTIEPMKP